MKDTDKARLRKSAEALLRQTSDPIDFPVESVLHELQVHQIELEMQNEALRKSQIVLEASRDRYFNLYEFAPVSYITLSKAGQMVEINLTGTALLGEGRKKLLLQRFSQYVLTVDQNRWEKFSLQASKHGAEPTCELFGMRKDGTHFNAYMDSRIIMNDEGESMLHLTLTDITKQKRAELHRRFFEERLLALTNREREVLSLALTGIASKDISIHLKISLRTVENYRLRIHRNKRNVNPSFNGNNWALPWILIHQFKCRVDKRSASTLWPMA